MLLVDPLFGSNAVSIMRSTFVASLALATLVLSGCASQTDAAPAVLARHHFAGLAALNQRPDLAQVQQVLALPQSHDLANTIARRLAANLPTWFGATALGTNDAGPLVPVLRSLLDAESYLEVQGDETRVNSWALAARINDDLAAKAANELRRVLGAGTPTPSAQPFEIAVGSAQTPARFTTNAGWIIVGSGRGPFDAFESALRTTGRPGPANTNAVLALTADVARIAKLIGLREKPPGPVDQWPTLEIAVEPRNGRLRTAAQMRFAHPLNLALQPWQMPTNVLRDPLVGFTAAQNAGTWLGRLGVFSDLGVTEWPKQLFLWSLAGEPWQQYFSAPIAAPTNLMAQISLTLPVRTVTNMSWSSSPFALRITNAATRVQLVGFPYLEPFMEAQRLADHEQLIGGLFPLAALSRQPAPAGLIAQVAGRTNLVLYDWETTGRRLFLTNPPSKTGPRVLTNDIGRLIQFKGMVQFAMLMFNRSGSALPATATGHLLIPGSAWIDAAIPLLGDTVTEVTQTHPSQLNLARQSTTGFNAMELIYLLRWIENPGFPGWQEPPPPAPRPSPPSGLRAVPPGTPQTP